MQIVQQSFSRFRIWAGAAAVYGVAAFAPALDGGGTPGDPAWSVVPFCAAFALAFLPWGAWADRHGAAAALRASSALLLIGGVVLLLPLGDGGWVTGRALEGLAAAGYPPAAQAALAALGGPARAGRSIGGMSVAVAVGSLLIPLVAGAGEGLLGTSAVLALGALGLPLLALAAVAPLSASGARRPGVPLVRSPGLLAAYACAFLVLIAYWTVVTRAAELLGPDGAGLGESGARAVPLVGGLLGMALTGAVAGIADRRGPRVPMVAVLGLGVAGLLLASIAATATAAVLGVAAFSLAYWCYLTLVGLQVVRSAPAAAHGRALGGLYTSMWTGAAVGGGIAATGAGWTLVLGMCAVAWAVAAAVAARWFLGARVARPRTVPPRDPAPSGLDARLATSSR